MALVITPIAAASISFAFARKYKLLQPIEPQKMQL
ncbi:hypothetical protein J2S36_000677 [Arcanobacterium hippocoleae]|uniref:Uncharacterized protein n=1 Tax=Arcanobacterium hippocoleae TaxID=149017 RepID=A0ABU1T192_9ACTO|nr:hypothetical protein [Arcanobacterium hippocoleae]